MAALGTTEVRPGSELAQACAQGDPEAFRALFEAYKDRVYSFALRFLNDESRAADLTQDIFVKLYRRIQDFRGDSKFETWLFRVVANACIDEQRKARRFLPFTGSEHPACVSGPKPQEDRMVRREEALAVREAIGKLSPALRVPMLLRYMEDRSYEEIAEILGIAVGTVSSRLNRGHRLLAKKLEKFRGKQR